MATVYLGDNNPYFASTASRSFSAWKWICATISWSRVALGHHYVSDVVAGTVSRR